MKNLQRTDDATRLYVNLTISNQCNLRCNYCYVFNSERPAANRLPGFVSDRVVEALAWKISAFCNLYPNTRPLVQLFGGEPLLIGQDRLSQIVHILKKTIEINAGQPLEFILQTNGTMLNAAWVNCLEKLGISVGISLDSPASTHDRHRRYINGKSSCRDALRGADLLGGSNAGRKIFRWILSVIDTRSNPKQAYRHLLELNLPSIEFLFPICNHINMPPGKNRPEDSVYADWLIPVFDEWLERDRNRIRLRPFDAMIKSLRGDGCFLDFIITGGPTQNIFVQTDGSITTDEINLTNQKETLRWNVFENELSDILPDQSTLSSTKHASLPDICRSCQYSKTCGGDYHEHRFGTDGTHSHASVYCADLKKLFAHIESRI